MRDAIPAPLRVARVIAMLQTVAGAVGAVLGGLEAAAASSGSNRSPLSGVAVAFGAAVAVAGLVTVMAVGVPLLVMRGGTQTRRVTGHGLLIAGEGLLLLPTAVFLGVRFGGLPTGTDQFSLALDLLLLVPVVVIVCLLMPSTRHWAYAPQVPSDPRVS